MILTYRIFDDQFGILLLSDLLTKGLLNYQEDCQCEDGYLEAYLSGIQNDQLMGILLNSFFIRNLRNAL